MRDGFVINVTVREFYYSFKKHYHCYKEIRGYEKTKRLILFYAVECGLKCRLMQRTGKNTYHELLACDEMDRLKKDGHNIRLLLQKNEVDRFRIGVIRMTGRQASVTPGEFNQLWRYGIKDTVYEDETAAEDVLCEIAVWLDGEI